MKTVVTGGLGFIGSYLVKLLLQNGHEVHVIDINKHAAYPVHPFLKVFHADICKKEEIDFLMSGADWVFHLAALTDVTTSLKTPRKYFDVNVTGTANVIEACEKAKVKRFIYAASASCYGDPSAFPTSEVSSLSFQSPYALTKYFGEELVIQWARHFFLPAISLRLFNVYGPKVSLSNSYAGVFGMFLKQKKENKPFTIVGDGNQTRDFVFVTDVAEAFYRAAQSDICGEIFNVGSGQEFSINQLTHILQGESIHLPQREGEVRRSWADISKIRDKLSWEPQVPFEVGVRKLLESFS